MASAARSSLLRQSAAFATPASRPMTLSTFTRTAPTKLLPRPSPALTLSHISAFHATSKRNLLPPGPRTF